VQATPEQAQKEQVLDALRKIIDPDFQQDIVTCGFVKSLVVEGSTVKFTLELTTPACPIKDEFQRQAEENVKVGAWQQPSLDRTHSALPPICHPANPR
jgi:metal-sulfur cluster biosynthetic enzyme